MFVMEDREKPDHDIVKVFRWSDFVGYSFGVKELINTHPFYQVNPAVDVSHADALCLYRKCKKNAFFVDRITNIPPNRFAIVCGMFDALLRYHNGLPRKIGHELTAPPQVEDNEDPKPLSAPVASPPKPTASPASLCPQQTASPAALPPQPTCTSPAMLPPMMPLQIPAPASAAAGYGNACSPEKKEVVDDLYSVVSQDPIVLQQVMSRMMQQNPAFMLQAVELVVTQHNPMMGMMIKQTIMNCQMQQQQQAQLYAQMQAQVELVRQMCQTEMSRHSAPKEDPPDHSLNDNI